MRVQSDILNGDRFDANMTSSGRMKTRAVPAILLAVLLLAPAPRGEGQTPSTQQVWSYRLLDKSSFLDDCPICGRPTIVQPMRGTFDLVLLEQSETNTIYRIAGEGIYRVGTNKNPQEMTLQTTINDSTNAYVFTLDTNVPLASITWPMISISLIETQQATLTHVYHLDLLAAPMREIWFSTVAGLTASKWQSPTNR